MPELLLMEYSAVQALVAVFLHLMPWFCLSKLQQITYSSGFEGACVWPEIGELGKSGAENFPHLLSLE